VDWLKPAIVFTALSSAVLAITFLYVWAQFVRRRHVLLWSLAWWVALPYLALQAATLHDPPSTLVLTVKQAFPMANALLMAAGCYELVHGRLPPLRAAAVALPVVAWGLLAPSLFTSDLLVTLPTSVLLGGAYLWTGSRFVRLHRERGTRGARLVAALFFVAGAHELDFPLFGDVAWAAPIGYALTGTLAFVISLFLIIMILEESRAQAEAERAMVRAIVDTLPVGVVVVSPAGKPLVANAAARAACATGPGGEVALPAFTRPDGKPLPAAELPIDRALRSGEQTPMRELVLRAPGGGARTVLVKAGPVRDDHGRLVGAVAVFEDIGDMKRMQAEASRTERLRSLGTLAAGVAHDFNNALTMIVGHVQLAMAAATDPVVRQQLGVVARVATDSASIVRRIQDVARVRVGRSDVAFDLAQVVREVVEICRPRWKDEAQADGVTYDVHADVALDVLVMGQPAEMREALLNLVLNALDAMPAGGSLRLAVSRDDARAVVTVEDTGEGMSADVQERIFEPYYTTKGAAGTGLGLAVVYGIVQRHDGTVEVESHPGVGTRFTIRLPLHVPERAPDAREPAEAAPRRLRVMVVDDEPLIRNLVQALLRQEGHDVAVAASGAEALEQLESASVDVVLTDLAMPGMNGWELAAAVRTAAPHAAVVLSTGWGESIAAGEPERAGVAAILPKPFTKDELVACVCRAAAAVEAG
jgi:signal transduction histidine kinase/CheY-like chemotaxis protein